MTVRELIEQLQQYDPNTLVTVADGRLIGFKKEITFVNIDEIAVHDGIVHLINGNDAYDLELYYREQAKAKREQAESWASELGIADAKAMSDDDLYTTLHLANIRYAGGWERYCDECGEAAFTEDGNGQEFCANCRFQDMASMGEIDAELGDVVTVGGVSFTY